MNKEFQNFIKNGSNVQIRKVKSGMLYFDANVSGGFGYLMKKRKLFKIPITPLILLS